MNPYGSHNDIRLVDGLFAQRLSVGPDMKRKIWGSDGKIGRIKEGKGVYERSSNGDRDQESGEDMPGSIPSVTGENGPEGMRRRQYRSLGRPLHSVLVNDNVHVHAERK